jgi:hypothetical protein
MPRSNRPRGRRQSDAEPVQPHLDALLTGWRRTEHRRGAVWNVQPVSAVQAVKPYTCPGCEQQIQPGTAHLVTWRADGVLGDDADLAARRHWHTHCWKLN